MPFFKNVHPYGEIDLVFHQVDDDKGNIVSRGRTVQLERDDVFEVSDIEASQIEDQVANFQKVEDGE